MQKLYFLKYSLISILLSVMFRAEAQSNDLYYRSAQNRLTNMLSGKESLNLREAIYCVENAWFNDKLNKKLFYKQIERYTDFCRAVSNSGRIIYSGNDVSSVNAQAAVFAFMTDTIPIQMGDSVYYHLPFGYNADDFAGEKNWSNMFVSTLMATGKGNCHSMPLLYKLIMDELGEKCWLALAPNHMYIKAKTQHIGWYNIELTTGDFPTDAWLMASGYIHLDAVRNGIYTDTLSLKQSVALCLTDLAQGYMRKYGIGNRKFIEDCCNTTLKHYPNYINALLIKAELLTKQYRHLDNKECEEAKKLKEKMDDAYAHIHRLGYRKMPEEMYRKWLKSIKTNIKTPFENF